MKERNIWTIDHIHTLCDFLISHIRAVESTKPSFCAFHNRPRRATRSAFQFANTKGRQFLRGTYSKTNGLKQSRCTSDRNISRGTFLIEQRGNEGRKSLSGENQRTKGSSTLIRNGSCELYKCSDGVGLNKQTLVGITENDVCGWIPGCQRRQERIHRR